MLFDQQERKQSPQGWALPWPAVGISTNDNVLRPSDVHFSDPLTYVTVSPILYADCEGLERGENTQLALQYRKNVSLP